MYWELARLLHSGAINGTLCISNEVHNAAGSHEYSIISPSILSVAHMILDGTMMLLGWRAAVGLIDGLGGVSSSSSRTLLTCWTVGMARRSGQDQEGACEYTSR
jgi:hypothetical protein